MENEEFLSDEKNIELVNESEILGDRTDFETPEILKGLFGEETVNETKETENKNIESSNENSQNTESQTVNDDEVGVDLMGAMTMINFGISMGGSLIADMFGYELPSDKILATDAQLKKLAKAGKPLYEKYLQNKMSAETAFIICLISVYGGKVLANIKKKQTKKIVSKKENKETETETEDWIGNPDYFQTGKKRGQLKPSK
jgi:hypothetical protein